MSFDKIAASMADDITFDELVSDKLETQTNASTDWPPQFCTYEEYAQQLEQLIAQHPPFGEFFNAKRSVAHVLAQCRIGLWSSSISELKQEYVQWETARRLERYARCHAAKYHLNQSHSMPEITRVQLIGIVSAIDSNYTPPKRDTLNSADI